MVEQHAEEMAILWWRRHLAVSQPNYQLKDLAKLDDQIEANIDGLRLAGDRGWEISKGRLSCGDPGEIFCAAVLAHETGRGSRIRTVLTQGDASQAASSGLVAALAWLPYEQVAWTIARLETDTHPELRRVGVAAAVAHRAIEGRGLKSALEHSEPSVRACAYRGVGKLGARAFLTRLRNGQREIDRECSYSASWGAALLGDPEAPAALRKLAEETGPHQVEAATLAARRSDVGLVRDWHGELAKNHLDRLAISVAGAMGDPALIGWLIEKMADVHLARAAGEAFAMITGVEIDRLHLDRPLPPGFDLGPSDDPKDEDVSMDPEENLTWPDPLRIEAWWRAHRNDFEAGRRYLCGKPISGQQCEHVIRHGYQPQRRAAAVELALMRPTQTLFEIRAPASRQQGLLGLLPRRG